MNRKQTKNLKDDSPETQNKLKVHYYHIRGKCQPIRNLLYYLNVQFEDVMHDKAKESQGQVGFNIGLPKLVDDEIVIHEAIAIMSYICTKYNKGYLIGQTPQSIAKTQQLLFKYNIQRNKIFGILLQSFKYLINSANKEHYVQNVFKKMLLQCKFIQYCLKNVIKTKSFIFGNITLADFLFYQICYYIVGFYQDYIKNNAYLRYFIEYTYFFQSLPFFEQQKDQIDQKFLFYEYNNKEINRQIEQLWKGKNSNVIRRKGIEV